MKLPESQSDSAKLKTIIYAIPPTIRCNSTSELGTILLFTYICEKRDYMHTMRLRVNDKVYDKLIGLLGKFSMDEVEVIPETNDFTMN